MDVLELMLSTSDQAAEACLSSKARGTFVDVLSSAFSSSSSLLRYRNRNQKTILATLAMIATMMKIQMKRGFLASPANGNSSSEPIAVVNRKMLITKVR